MRKFRSFARGGIHPPGNKGLTSDKAIRNAPLPAVAVVPFSQHIGAPAKPLVQPGDHVEEAQMIGEPAGFISASVHSPIPGIVKEIKSIYLPSGTRTDAAVIELDGEFSRLGKPHTPRDWTKMSVEEILEVLRNHGVVGQGGATFPSHVKFSVPKGRTCEVFLVNAAECEPYLSADHRVMLENTEDIIEGIRIIRKLLSPERIIIGIEANKPDAVEALTAAGAPEGIEVMPLKVKYPQGAEKNLIEATIGREVPSGKLPIEVGVINANVGTLISVCEAVRDDKPVIERVVTISGGAIANPGNIRVRVGSSIRDLIEECGGLTEEPEKFVSGGPMMGFTFSNLDSPVIKGTSGILALTAKEVKHFSATACLSCGRCIQACPMGLSPTTIFKNIEHERFDEATAYGLEDCVLCGSCAYVCPAHIPLVSAFKAGRGRKRRLSARNKG
jgi:electron transport complex protein RnfC